jgi:hypothetical protein
MDFEQFENEMNARKLFDESGDLGLDMSYFYLDRIKHSEYFIKLDFDYEPVTALLVSRNALTFTDTDECILQEFETLESAIHWIDTLQSLEKSGLC